MRKTEFGSIVFAGSALFQLVASSGCVRQQNSSELLATTLPPPAETALEPA